MARISIDAQLVIQMFFAGAQNLENNKSWVNELNVFPVPDGDTGTNMLMTLTSASHELKALPSPSSMAAVAKAVSFGSLRGARGNSGVILSQLLRGFCKIVRNYEELDAGAISEACARAVETAYKAVMKPKEGTILTVSRGISDKWTELAAEESDLEILFAKTLAHGDEVLEHTPELLPVLKEAGVVDSGGAGLMAFLKGCYEAMMGREVPAAGAAPQNKAPEASPEEAGEAIAFTYHLELALLPDAHVSEKNVTAFRIYLESLGDGAEIRRDGALLTAEVNTNEPGTALQKALTLGTLLDSKIENRFQKRENIPATEAEHSDAAPESVPAETAAQNAPASAAGEPAAIPESEWKDYGFVSTAFGEGLCNVFRELGVDAIVEGGQTMNPSTEDMLRAIETVPARNVFIFPNNKNILLAAEQAKKLTKDRRVLIVPSVTIPQGVTAIMNFDAEVTPRENLKRMKASLGEVESGEITYAIRTTKVAGVEIHEGDFIALGGKSGLYCSGKDIGDVAENMIEKMMKEDAGLITLYSGADVAPDDAEALRGKLAEKYGGCDVVHIRGGQPVYYYIVSVE